METRFFAPVVIATAFHALVLLGFNSKPKPAPVIPKEIEKPPVQMEITLDPPEPEEPLIAETPALQKGEPDLKPRLDEPVAVVRDFEIPSERSNPIPQNVVDRLIAAPIGDPLGSETVVRTCTILTSDLLDNPPRTRARVSPTYPSAERSAGVEGEVLVEFVVDESGKVTQPFVVRSSRASFERPTLRAVEKWRFEPGKKDGRAVRFRMQIPVHFSLST